MTDSIKMIAAIQKFKFWGYVESSYACQFLTIEFNAGFEGMALYDSKTNVLFCVLGYDRQRLPNAHVSKWIKKRKLYILKEMRRRLSLRFKEKSLSTSNYVSKTSFKLWKFNVFIGSGGKTQHFFKKIWPIRLLPHFEIL